MVDGRNSECKECVNRHSREREDRNAMRASTKKWKSNNHRSVKEYQREWRIENIDHVRQDARNRYANDLNHRIASIVRSRVRSGLKKGKVVKSIQTEELLGCSFEELKMKLESKFVLGMSWDNFGKWHIDHIRPCSSFNLSEEDEQRKCFHFSNLQPLWAHDNLVKSSRIPKDILLT